MISNNSNSGAVQFAKDNSIDFKIINKSKFPKTEQIEYENGSPWFAPRPVTQGDEEE